MGCNAPAPWLKAKDGQGTAGAAAIKQEEEVEAAAEEQEQEQDDSDGEGEQGGEGEKKVEVRAPLANAQHSKGSLASNLCKLLSNCCAHLVGAERVRRWRGWAGCAGEGRPRLSDRLWGLVDRELPDGIHSAGRAQGQGEGAHLQEPWQERR